MTKSQNQYLSLTYLLVQTSIPFILHLICKDKQTTEIEVSQGNPENLIRPFGNSNTVFPKK